MSDHPVQYTIKQVVVILFVPFLFLKVTFTL